MGSSRSGGMVETGTNTELAKTSGKITTNPAVWAASAPHRDNAGRDGIAAGRV